MLRPESGPMVLVELLSTRFPDESQESFVHLFEALAQLRLRPRTALTVVGRSSEFGSVLRSREHNADAPDVLPSRRGVLPFPSPTESQLGQIPVHVAIVAFEPSHRHLHLTLALFDGGNLAR